MPEYEWPYNISFRSISEVGEKFHGRRMEAAWTNKLKINHLMKVSENKPFTYTIYPYNVQGSNHKKYNPQKHLITKCYELNAKYHNHSFVSLTC